MEKTSRPETEDDPAKMPEKFRWKRSYTWVLTANVLYILFFYFLMIQFS